MGDSKVSFVHPTAVVDPGARIGPRTKVWHFCHVMEGATIGPDCVLGQNVFVGNVQVGRGCRVQNNVSLYDGVVLEEDVFVGPSAVFTNVRTPRAHVSRKDEFAPTVVRKGATIGANATVVCGVEIGSYALVAAGAVVTRDVAPHRVVAGVPARPVGWACRCGEILHPDGQGRAACRRCGDRYQVEKDRLVVLETGEDGGEDRP